jgi:hypothetical protein
VLDWDVQSFFDKVSQDWLIRFVEHRIGDRRIVRLIAKWLTAGVFAAAGHPFTAAVSGAGALSRRPRGAQAPSSLTGVPKPEPALHQPAPRNALLAAFLTRDDATERRDR